MAAGGTGDSAAAASFDAAVRAFDVQAQAAEAKAAETKAATPGFQPRRVEVVAYLTSNNGDCDCSKIIYSSSDHIRRLRYMDRPKKRLRLEQPPSEVT